MSQYLEIYGGRSRPTPHVFCFRQLRIFLVTSDQTQSIPERQAVIRPDFTSFTYELTAQITRDSEYGYPTAEIFIIVRL